MSGVAIHDTAVAQPGNGRAIAAQVGFAQDWVMSAAVEMDEQTSRFDLDAAAGFDELAVEVLRLGLGEAVQLLGQPAVAAIGDDRQGHVEVDIEPDLAGQAIKVEEVDADAQAVFNAVAARVAQYDIACANVVV